jgi:hypothetical protein
MSSLVVSSIANASGVSLVQPGFRNVLINAGFTINQRAYASAATLAAGAYGHDRFKAGASGGNYTFTQLNSTTQITIASGKSLIQVVEDKNVYGGSYVLSWTGTAQARVGVNSATPSGSYAASPILITGQTAGTTMSVEFNTGTLSAPQLELGTVRTSFEVRPYGTELALCQRYYETVYMYDEPEKGNYYAGWRYLPGLPFTITKRINPSIVVTGQGGWPYGSGGTYFISASVTRVQIIGQSGAAVTNELHTYYLTASAEL